MAVLVELVHKREQTKLFRAIVLQKKEFSFAVFQKLLRKKDIRVNGRKVSENVDVFDGDKISIFLPDEKTKKTAEIVFSDANVVVANKPAGVEVEADDGESFLSIVEATVGSKVFAVHRLDRNTTGLVVFARNRVAETELLKAFRDRTIHKFYLARVYGHMEKREAQLVAWLKKDEREMRSIVQDRPAPGFVKIETNYRELSREPESAKNPIRTSLLEVELLTGKMHQIRAHLAFLGHPIVGDGKYADNAANQKMKQKKQFLCAYRICFEFAKESPLAYLSGKEISIDCGV